MGECPRIAPKRTQVTGWLRPGRGTAHFSWLLVQLPATRCQKLGRNRGDQRLYYLVFRGQNGNFGLKDWHPYRDRIRIAESSLVGRLSFTIAVLVFIAAARAQTVAGVVRGVIADPSGGHVPGVTVALTSQETRARRSATSDARGEFTITAVPPGEYLLEAEHQGFLKYAQRLMMEVNQDQYIHVEIGLAMAGTETIEVAGIAPLVRTESSAMGSVIDNRQILGLPLDGRNFYQLSLLLPGVVPPAQGSAGSVRGAFSISVNGAREDANNFLLDGAYNGDPKLNGASVTPPVDAIREFEVATSTYDTSFGRNAGGEIGVVTRSGGNQFHGTAYEFFRNGALDGSNFFSPSDQPAPKYRRNQFGGTLGERAPAPSTLARTLRISTRPC